MTYFPMLLYIVTRPKVKSLPFYIPGRRTKVHLSGGSSQCRPLKGIPPPPPGLLSVLLGHALVSTRAEKQKAACLICFLVLFQSVFDWPGLFSEL